MIEEMVNVDSRMELSSMTLHTSQLVQMTRDLQLREEELEMSKHARESATEMKHARHSTSTYLIQEPTTIVGFGQHLIIFQMVQIKHTAT